MSHVTGRPPSIPKALLVRIRRFIVEERLIQQGDRLLAGVSGGPDSTCLLIALAALRHSLKFELHAAHFDHQLRGRRAAARERESVRTLVTAVDVPLAVGSADVSAHARKHKRSIEEAARDRRYAFLAQQAASSACNVVAVGHTRDDQAETVLLHLIRGSGLRGLAAMSPVSKWPVPLDSAPRLIRPLLDTSRDETEDACTAAGIKPVDDPSNRSDAQTRARIRHDLVPVLRQFNPQIDSALARLASAAAHDVEVLETLARQLLISGKSHEDVRIERRRMASSPLAIQRHAVRLAASQLLGDTRDISDRNVRSVLSIAGGRTGATSKLAQGLHVTVGRTYLTFSTRTKEAERLPRRPVSLRLPGRTKVGHWTFETELFKSRPRDVKERRQRTVVLDAVACGEHLRVRGRRDGDRFQPLGLSKPKKLQDFFVDAHVPRDERDGVPLVYCEHGIVWVVGHQPAEWAKVTSKTRKFLRITGDA